jgi:Transglycosylase SLT domain
MIRDGTNQGSLLLRSQSCRSFPREAPLPLHNQDSAMIRNLSLTTILVAFAAAASPAFAQKQRSAILDANGNLDALIARHAAANNVPEDLVRRVIRRESGGDPRAVSQGNYGLMQIKLATARSMGYAGNAAGLLDADTKPAPIASRTAMPRGPCTIMPPVITMPRRTKALPCRQAPRRMALSRLQAASSSVQNENCVRRTRRTATPRAPGVFIAGARTPTDRAPQPC